MYLDSLKLWNFRKYGSSSGFDIATPHLIIFFKKGINLLIGENDSGKTAIIDAIKLVLKTHSAEWIRVEHEDFFEDTHRFRIECLFKGLEVVEAQNFIEWLGFEGQGTNATSYLRVFLDVTRKEGKILPYDVKAGVDEEGKMLTAVAKNKLLSVYLKPLRDAKNELIPKRNSRLSQILIGHDAFDEHGSPHLLVNLARELNNHISAYFRGENSSGVVLTGRDALGKKVKETIDLYLREFSNHSSKFQTSDQKLKNILESLSLLFEEGYNLGLGSHNLLFIATELLHLQKENWDGLRLGLIEEIEAHLHPQVQLQVVETLEKKTSNVQLIFTTHSPNIASKITLSRIIICQENSVFSLDEAYTKLDPTDYKFLERFLDVTKANLFFAKGVILVEGWSEEIILGELARLIGKNLTASGISVINIGNTAFLRYCRIFIRKQEPQMKTKVSVISDVDVKPLLARDTKKVIDQNGNESLVPYTQDEINQRIEESKRNKISKYESQVVKAHISPLWTLEYCISLSLKLRKIFYKSVLQALLIQKMDEGVQNLTNYQTAISNVDTYFNSWTDSDEEIAFIICDHIFEGRTTIAVAKDKISKTIIAQCFSENLKSILIDDIGDLHEDSSIKYILDAIEYVCVNN